jgi:hypothetical protein
MGGVSGEWGAAHRLVVELIHDLVACRSGEGVESTVARWRLSLSLSVPTLAADEVRRYASALPLTFRAGAA